MFTYQYTQPDGYHFSLDSIGLAEFVAEELKLIPNLNTWQVLDLCAGCGVIGIEMSWYLRELRKIDFIEVQEIYIPYFQKNVALVNRPELQLRLHTINYEALLEDHWKNKFDLIVSNPPYFQPKHGMLSPSEFKNRCRFFIDSTFQCFISAMANALAPNGRAYFLLRSLHQHGYDAFLDMQKILENTGVTSKKISKIRGTDVILLEK